MQQGAYYTLRGKQNVWISVLRTRKSMAACTAELQWRS
jgi:hypothetical protein